MSDREIATRHSCLNLCDFLLSLCPSWPTGW